MSTPATNLDKVHKSIDISQSTYRKIFIRLIPFLMLCYMFAYLDRINIGFAKLQMQDAIGLSDAAYGIGAGIFFLGYVIFEIPSNLYLAKVGAKKTLVRIMILWGATSSCMMFVHSPNLFYLLRFLLGVFEAGFAPGIIYYLTLWFPNKRLGGAMTVFLFAGPVGSLIGAPLSTWLMESFHNQQGFSGWQWMFLIEGIPCIILGVITWFIVVDNPDNAKWLTIKEKDELKVALSYNSSSKHSSFLSLLKSAIIYKLSAIFFCLICGIYAMSFWLPTILKTHGISNTMSLGYIATLPYIAAIIMMGLLSKSSTLFKEYSYHIALSLFIAGISLLISNFTSNLTTSIALLCLATGLVWASYAVFWSIPSKLMKGSAAAAGIALINSFGLLGGFVSPILLGFIKESTGSLTIGLCIMTALLIIGAFLSISLKNYND